jgi:hypothetical protein
VSPIAAATAEPEVDPPAVKDTVPVPDDVEPVTPVESPYGSASVQVTEDTVLPPPDTRPLATDPSLDDAAAMNIRPPEDIPGMTVRPWSDEEIAAFEKAYETTQEETTAKPAAIENTDVEEIIPSHTTDDSAEKEAMRLWKAEHPETTIKEQRRLLERGMIDQLPWQVGLEADNTAKAARMRGFGIVFPTDAVKGDQFLRVDSLPSILYKFNGSKWIQVDKATSDQYAFDTAYIDHLITKLESGEYDPDLLNDVEREQIAIRLNQQT